MPQDRPTYEERSAASARALLDAAVHEIAEKGWERTTSADITRRAGLSGGMVNVRYGSKEALLAALLEAYTDRFAVQSDPGRSGLEGLVERVTTLRQLAQTDPVSLRAFLRVCFEASVVGGAAGPWVEQWFTDYARDLQSLIERGQADGSIRGDADAAAEAQSFLDAGTGICFTWIVRHDADQLDAALALFAQQTEAWLGR